MIRKKGNAKELKQRVQEYIQRDGGPPDVIDNVVTSKRCMNYYTHGIVF